MKLVSWNVNGIRACSRYGFLDWLDAQKPSVLCLQETKAHPEQLEAGLREPEGYKTFWSSAQKRGYSGVALFLRVPFLNVTEGIGIDAFDQEGRTLTAEFNDFFVVTTYVPNGQPDHKRVGFKLEYSEQLLQYLQKLRKQKPVIVCGDFNTAHEEIDLARPKENQNTTGFLPREREFLTRFIEHGYVDCFRSFEKGSGHYTWWSYRTAARKRNIGWRIDYFFVSDELKESVKKSYHLPDVVGSDHCPVLIEI